MIIGYTDAALALQRENFEGPKTWRLALQPGWCTPLGRTLACGSLPGPGSLPGYPQNKRRRIGRLPGTVSHFAGTPRPAAAGIARPTFPGSMAASRPGSAVQAACLLATSRREPGLDSGAAAGPACPAAATVRLRALVS